MRAMNASTASIWASSSRSWRLESTVHGFIRYLSKPGRLVPALDQWRRRAAEQAESCVMPQPCVIAAIGRSGATSGTLEKSNGLAISATEDTGSDGSWASASSARMPPRHQPTTWTGRPPASSDAARIAFGTTSSIQCSRPSPRSAYSISP